MAHDAESDTIADLQRSITATLTYIVGRASVAELFGLHAYLSTLASQMAPVDAQRFAQPETAVVLRQKLADMERQKRMQQDLVHCTPAPYRQEG